MVGDRVASLYQLRIQGRSLKARSDHKLHCQHTWHRRVGHRDPNVLPLMKKDDLVSGFDYIDCGARITCESCLKGKLARKPFPAVTERKATRPLDLVHTDLCGPMENTTPSGNRYFMTMIDDFSRYTVVYLLKNKSEAAGKIKQYVRWTQNKFGRKPLIIRSDGGGSISTGICESSTRRRVSRHNLQRRIPRSRTGSPSARIGLFKKWRSVCWRTRTWRNCIGARRQRQQRTSKTGCRPELLVKPLTSCGKDANPIWHTYECLAAMRTSMSRMRSEQSWTTNPSNLRSSVTLKIKKGTDSWIVQPSG